MSPRARSFGVFFFAAALIYPSPELAFSQNAGFEDPAYQSLSKSMRLAVDLYEKGQDLDAMDRFMDILVKGDPSERSIANDYLNLITQRMAIGGGAAAPTGSGESRPDTSARDEERPRAKPPEDDSRPPIRSRRAAEEEEPPAPPERVERPRRGGERFTKDDKRLMTVEIDGKMQAKTRASLAQLRRWDSILIRMTNSRLPRAIGLPSSLLYESDLKFKPDSVKILNLLTDLVFSLGASQVVILPEGAIMGDAKILDMRRSMGVSSHLFRAGVAPPRLRVNLLSSQVDIPRDLNSFKGILFVFVHNQPLNLGTESEIGSENGPPLSLGVSPEVIDPDSGDGSIIEFSVMEPPTGLMSWRFQLFGPSTEADPEPRPLQEVRGSGPVFHQIYWNAREKYFGAPFPPGRYEALLTGTDSKNRTKKIRSWIKVSSKRSQFEEPVPEEIESTKPRTPSSPPPASLPGATSPSLGKTLTPPLAKGRSSGAQGRAERRRRRTASPKPDSTPTPQSGDVEAKSSETPTEKKGASSEPAGSRAGAVNYQVHFQNATASITKEGEGILQRVADTMHYYPLDNIHLVGYAHSAEPDSSGLALKRAQIVSKLLVERHGMKQSRIQVDTKILDSESSKVEIYIVAGGQ